MLRRTIGVLLLVMWWLLLLLLGANTLRETLLLVNPQQVVLCLSLTLGILHRTEARTPSPYSGVIKVDGVVALRKWIAGADTFSQWRDAAW